MATADYVFREHGRMRGGPRQGILTDDARQGSLQILGVFYQICAASWVVRRIGARIVVATLVLV